jgi:hypothetical protein
VDPSDYRNLLATVIDMSTTVPGGRQLINKYAFSSDNGETWVDSFIPIDPVTGLLPTGDGQLWSLAVDPVVAIDNGGNAYLASLYRRFEKPSALSGVYVSVTTVDSLKRLGTDPDAGFTVAQTYLVAANIDPKKNNTLEDKPWIAVDNSDSAYSGNVYLAWTHVTEGGGFDIVFSRSTDHGRTWSEPLRIGHPGGAVQGAQVAVGPDGEIYVVYGKQVLGWKNGQLFLVKSTDGGVTFSDPVSITPKFNTLSFDSTYAKYSLPALAVSPTNGNVYVVYADQPNDMVGGEVELIISTDGGATFSAPAPLNDRSAGQQFMPAVTVDERGVIHASWFDTRNNPSGTSILDIYAAYSTDGGRTFRPNARVTATSFDVGASPFIGDYSGIAAAGGFAHPVWTTGFTPVPGGSPIGGLRTATLTTTDGSPLLAATAGPNRAPAALTSQEADSLLAEASADRPNWLDDNAAGWGWFVDPTPHNDSEFTTPGNQGERNRMDLLTVIEHEVGHMLGKDHEADGVMQETLTAGTRLAAFASSDADWLAAIDGLFAEARSKKRK